jgi:hypothetical protein
VKREPTITVNGVTLTEAQAMSVRVAVTSFRMELHGGYDKVLGEIGPLYDARLYEVEKLMLAPGGDPGAGRAYKRDPESDCEYFAQGPVHMLADCETDGHYMCGYCRENVHRKPPAPSGEAGRAT